MKKILIIHTGGTIGSATEETERAMNENTVREAKRLLFDNFFASKSKYSACTDMLEDANFPELKTTLSESMSLERLADILEHLSSFDFEKYDGIIVLHGTDTLAFTAALFSYFYSTVKIPMILVSGNRPPDDALSNANVNFKTAVELIWEGIAPNVYAVYRNSDNIIRLFLGSTLMQCPNCSEDFRSASKKNEFELINSQERELFTSCDGGMLNKCDVLSRHRNNRAVGGIKGIRLVPHQVLLIYPYLGMDYSVYSSYIEANSNACQGIVHGTYHSGTVSLPGLVCEAKMHEIQKRLKESQENNLPKNQSLKHEISELAKTADAQKRSKYSILYLSERCKHIPIYIAPSKLGKAQYETMTAVHEQSHAVLLNMTAEAAYAKLIFALSCGLKNDSQSKYMQTDICNEMLD